MSLPYRTHGSSTLIHLPQQPLSTAHFSAAYWQHKQAIVKDVIGRHCAWVVRADDHCKWVLRHYYRGGLLAQLNQRHFLYTGIRRSRVYQEAQLLFDMAKLGLPVPQLVGGLLERRGASYRASLLCHYLEETQTLAKICQQQPLANSIWYRIGATIARFHAAGINHVDLNAHNILLDRNQTVWLIDFDRCQQQHPGPWQQGNLQRLHRSLSKCDRLYREFHWQTTAWHAFLDGYQSYEDTYDKHDCSVDQRLSASTARNNSRGITRT